MGTVLPREGFLEGLRTLCDEEGIVLIFDEVMTGFRVAYGGVQELYGVTPDLTTLGKIIGGGLPVGAFGGKKEIMSLLSPSGGVYQAGTLSGNPLAMTAGIETLKLLQEDGFYRRLEEKSAMLAEGIRIWQKMRGVQSIPQESAACSVCSLPKTKCMTGQRLQTVTPSVSPVTSAPCWSRGFTSHLSQFETAFVSSRPQR